jgi:hypothetical protein
VARSDKRRRLTADERARGTALIRSIELRAANAGHVLSQAVLQPVGSKGVSRYVLTCSCGETFIGPNVMQVLKPGFGHLGDVLGENARGQVATVLSGSPAARARNESGNDGPNGERVERSETREPERVSLPWEYAAQHR